MREFFNYLRRWWRLLLLGVVLGAAVGFIWHARFTADTEYQATVEVRLSWITFQLVSAVLPSEEAAILHAGENLPLFNRLALYSLAFSDIAREGLLTSVQKDLQSVHTILPEFTPAPESLKSAEITGVSVERWVGQPAWKPVVLGGTIGLLIIVGGIQVWEGLLRDRGSKDDSEQ